MSRLCYVQKTGLKCECGKEAKAIIFIDEILAVGCDTCGNEFWFMDGIEPVDWIIYEDKGKENERPETNVQRM